MKKIIKYFCYLLLSLLLIIIIFSFYIIIKQGKELKQFQFTNINISKIPDGIYMGSANTSLVDVEVKVRISNGKIHTINILKHVNGLGSKAESITDNMIANNTYDVDAISGATASSTVIKKAVNNALQSSTIYNEK